MSEDANARLPATLRRQLENVPIDTDDAIDAARRRFDNRLGRELPRHLVAYRGYADERGAEARLRIELGKFIATRPQDRFAAHALRTGFPGLIPGIPRAPGQDEDRGPVVG